MSLRNRGNEVLEREYQLIYPQVESVDQQIDCDSDDSDSRLDTFNELEELFNSVAIKHTQYIDARKENKVEESAQLATELLSLEKHFRDKLRNLTQFQEQEDDLEAQYIEKLRAIGSFVETEIKKSNIKTQQKEEFGTLIEELSTTVNNLNSFKDQRLFPDQFRILRSTATGVRNKLTIQIQQLQKDLASEQKSVERKVRQETALLNASVVAATQFKESLEKELTEYAQQVEKLEKDNSDLTAEVESLKRDVSSLKTELEFAEGENQTLESSLLSDNSTFEKKTNELKRQFERTILEKDSLLENTRLTNNTLKSELSSKERQYTKEISDQNKDFTHQIELLKQENLLLQGQLNKFSEFSELLANVYEKNHLELVELYKEIDQKQDDLNTKYKSSVEIIKESLTHIQRDLADGKQTAEETADKVNKLNQGHNKTLFEDLNESSNEAIGNWTFSPLQVPQLRQKAERKSLTQAEAQIEILSNTVAGLNRTLTENQRTTEQLREELAERLATLTDNRNNIEDLNNIIADLQAQNPNFNMDEGMAVLTRNLGELFSREEKKTIPYFNGQHDGKSIYDWLKHAERIGENNEWDDQQKVKNFSDRLTNEALDWHSEFMSDLPIDPRTGNLAANPPRAPTDKYTRANLPYEIWKNAFIERFTNLGHKEKLRNKLNSLKQHTDQDVQSFISKINNLYNLVNGPSIKINGVPTVGEAILKEENERLRNQDKLKIFIKGLLPKLRNEMWPRMTVNADYDQACRTALEAEGILINKQLSEEKELTAVVAGMTVHEEEQDNKLKKQQTEIDILKRHINEIQFSNHLSQGMDNSPKLIAAVSEERPQSRIRFDRSLSADKDKRSGSEERRNYHSRSSSPYPRRYNKEERERPNRYFNNENKVDFNNQRGRSHSADHGRRDIRDRSYSNNRRFEERNSFRPISRNQSLERFPRFNQNRFQDERRPFFQEGRVSIRRPFRQFNQTRTGGERRNFSGNNRPNGSTQARGRQICYYCQKPGHIEAVCRQKERNSRRVNERPQLPRN